METLWADKDFLRKLCFQSIKIYGYAKLIAPTTNNISIYITH